MSKSQPNWIAMAFACLFVATATLYILRGLTLFTAFPGSILWVLLFGTLITGLWCLLQVLR